MMDFDLDKAQDSSLSMVIMINTLTIVYHVFMPHNLFPVKPWLL